MPKQPLQRVEIRSGLEHVGGEAVAEHVDATGLLDLRSLLGSRERMLERCGAQMTLPIA